ncbi:MAG: glutamate mutase L [Jatrophihabitantaceae bacterium]
MTVAFSLLLMDIGSTSIKWCVVSSDGQLGAMSREWRDPDVPAGQQAMAIADRYPGLPLRVCSSARGGLRVGLLGLTDRYSLTAGRRAVLAAGGQLSYAGQLPDARQLPDAHQLPADQLLDAHQLANAGHLGSAAGCPDPVDVLVLVGGTDGGDHRHLSAALAAFHPNDHPHATLVWAGASDAALDLQVRHRVTNVQDDQLRPTPAGLTTLLRQLRSAIDGLGDSVGQQQLEVLASRIDGPVLPTFVAVGMAADELASERQAVLVIDVGGTATDLHYRHGRPPAGTSIRRTFPELGLAGARAALAARIADEPLLYELIEAIAPADPRTLYQRLRDADPAALAGPVGFLACLFLSVQDLNLDLSDADVLVTGGAGTDPATIARMLHAATGHRASSVTVDDQLWARGLHRDARVIAGTGLLR